MPPRRAAWAVLAALAVAAAPYSVALSTGQCAPLAADAAAALGADWAPLAAFAERCTVPGPDGRPAVSVDIARLDRASAGDFFKFHALATMPLPIVRDAAGSAVGTLPEQFPADGAGRLQVRFARWRGGVPQEIRLYQAGASAIPPHAVPTLHRDPATGRYR